MSSSDRLEVVEPVALVNVEVADAAREFVTDAADLAGQRGLRPARCPPPTGGLYDTHSWYRHHRTVTRSTGDEPGRGTHIVIGLHLPPHPAADGCSSSNAARPRACPRFDPLSAGVATGSFQPVRTPVAGSASSAERGQHGDQDRAGQRVTVAPTRRQRRLRATRAWAPACRTRFGQTDQRQCQCQGCRHHHQNPDRGRAFRRCGTCPPWRSPAGQRGGDGQRRPATTRRDPARTAPLRALRRIQPVAQALLIAADREDPLIGSGAEHHGRHQGDREQRHLEHTGTTEHRGRSAGRRPTPIRPRTTG